MIILISGKAGSGKDFTTKELVNYFIKEGFETINISFAYPMKEDAMYMGWDSNKDEAGRKLLQNLGKVYREYNKNIFVNKLMDTISRFNETNITLFVVSDCRFINEIEEIEKKFDDVVKIRINCSQKSKENWREDISECDLDNYDKWDYIIENDFKDTYRQKVRGIGKKIMKNLFGFNKYLVSNEKCSQVPKKTELIFEFPNKFIVSVLHENYTKIDIDIINAEINEQKDREFRKFMGDDFLTLTRAKECLNFILKL